MMYLQQDKSIFRDVSLRDHITFLIYKIEHNTIGHTDPYGVTLERATLLLLLILGKEYGHDVDQTDSSPPKLFSKEQDPRS